MVVNTNFIPEKTAALFEKFTVLPFIGRFTLVGGTALALQTGHRQSEDLDFIYDGEKIPTTSIKREISKHFQKYRLIREDKDYQLDFLIDEVRVTFFSTGAVMVPFSVKDYSEKYLNINIAGIEIIAVLKIGTLAQRNTIRNYYDLYFIAKYFITLSGIIEKSKILLPNISAITYTETIIYTDDLAENSIENHLKPKEILSKKQISEFFIAELTKIKNP